MNRKDKTLLGLLLFNGLSASAGGLALMTDWIPGQAQQPMQGRAVATHDPQVRQRGAAVAAECDPAAVR